MKTGQNDGLTLAHRINNFLLTYRTTPHATTGTPPCELLMGRTLRTRWDLLKPDVGQRVCWRQSKQKEGKDGNNPLRHFVTGQSVMVKNFRMGPTWLSGVIVQQLGPLTYLVEISAGKFWKRHVDHVKDYPSKGLSSVPVSDQNEDDEFSAPLVRTSREEHTPTSTGAMNPSPDLARVVGTDLSNPDQEEPPARRYPERQRRGPTRYGITS